MSLIIRRPWTRQPPWPARLAALFRRAAFAYLPSVGNNLIDMNGRWLSQVNALDRGRGDGGVYIKGNSGGRSNAYLAATISDATLTAATLISIQRLPTLATNYGWHHWQSDATNSHVAFSSSIYLSTFSSSRWLNGVAVPAGYDKVHAFIVRANGTARQAWQGTTSLGTATSDSTVRLPSNFFVANDDPTYYLGVECYALVMLPWALTDAEVLAVAANPWSLFEPLPRHFWVPDTVSGPTTINADVGAWTWAGTPAKLAHQINATVGPWSWAGVQSKLATQINASVGAWTWAGTPAVLARNINATVGAWSWSGLSASFSHQIQATVGVWTWTGVPATLVTVINATPGTWSWGGVPAAIAKDIAATVGTWAWAGVHATLDGTVDATVGTWAWTGAPAKIAVNLNANVGSWAWTGRPARLAVNIAAQVASWEWTGINATVISDYFPRIQRVILGAKIVGVATAVEFDFISRIRKGATLSNPVVTSVVYSGADPTPGALINGSATIRNRTVVRQDLTAGGGLPGVSYKLTCTATSSADGEVVLQGILASRATPPDPPEIPVWP